MSHYYDENPDVKSDEKHITYECYQQSIDLITDNGVFLEIELIMDLTY